MQMLLGYRITHVPYSAGFLYKYLKLNLIINILFQCKILALANFLTVALAKYQYWSESYLVYIQRVVILYNQGTN